MPRGSPVVMRSRSDLNLSRLNDSFCQVQSCKVDYFIENPKNDSIIGSQNQILKRGKSEIFQKKYPAVQKSVILNYNHVFV